MREDDEGLARKIICSLQMSLRGRCCRMPVADGQWSALDCDVEMSVWSLEMSNNALGGKTQDVRPLIPPTYGPKLSPYLATPLESENFLVLFFFFLFVLRDEVVSASHARLPDSSARTYPFFVQVLGYQQQETPFPSDAGTHISSAREERTPMLNVQLEDSYMQR